MKTKQVWVSPDSKGGWRVHQPNAKRDSAHVENKAPAIKRATEIAKNIWAELKIQNMDGKISQSNSHGNDPCPPRDTK